MAGVDTICFDKTGTLTESQPVVTKITALDSNYSEERVLGLAARAEWHSQHPLAGAILERAKRDHALSGTNLDEFEVLAGRGVRSWTGEDEILVGNERLLNEFGMSLSEAASRALRDIRSARGIGHVCCASPQARWLNRYLCAGSERSARCRSATRDWPASTRL